MRREVGTAALSAFELVRHIAACRRRSAVWTNEKRTGSRSKSFAPLTSMSELITRSSLRLNVCTTWRGADRAARSSSVKSPQ